MHLNFMKKIISFLNKSVIYKSIMWILITVILKTNSLEGITPVYLKPKIHDTFKKCELNLDQIHEDLIKLTYNYPVEVKVEYDENKKKYLKYSYKTDYTKPTKTQYYHCEKI